MKEASSFGLLRMDVARRVRLCGGRSRRSIQLSKRMSASANIARGMCGLRRECSVRNVETEVQTLEEFHLSNIQIVKWQTGNFRPGFVCIGMIVENLVCEHEGGL